MPITPILKPFHLRKLPNDYPMIKVTSDFAPLVSVTIADVTVQCHRINLITHDHNGRIWNVYIYTDKDRTLLYGIDGTAVSDEASREASPTYDSPFAPLLSHFDGGLEIPHFGEPAQLLAYPEILSNQSFYIEDILYVATLGVTGPHVDEGTGVAPGRLYQPHVDVNDDGHYPMYVLYETGGFLKLLILESNE